MTKITFDAILEDDLDWLMESLNLKAQLKSGKLKCSHCKLALSKSNIASIYPISGDIKVTCEAKSCINKTLDQTK